jgi:hypothetical protein
MGHRAMRNVFLTHLRADDGSAAVCCMSVPRPC